MLALPEAETAIHPLLAMILYPLLFLVAVGLVFALVVVVTGASFKKGGDTAKKAAVERELKVSAVKAMVSPDFTIGMKDHGKFASAAEKSQPCAKNPPVPCIITRIAVDSDSRKIFMTMFHLQPGWPIRKSEGVFGFDDIQRIVTDSFQTFVDRGSLGTREQDVPMIRFELKGGSPERAWLVVNEDDGLDAYRLFQDLKGALKGDTPATSARCPAPERHGPSGPRAVPWFWASMAAVVVVLGPVSAASGYWEEEPGLVLSGWFLALIGMQCTGFWLTQRRQPKVPESGRSPSIDAQLMLSTGCVLCGLIAAQVHTGWPMSWYRPVFDTLSDGVAMVASSDLDGSGEDTPQHALSLAQSQRVLARFGHYDGAVDGLMGPSTRGAIRQFERARDLSVDGRLSGSDHGALLKAWQVSEVEEALREEGYPIDQIDGRAEEELRQYVFEHLGHPAFDDEGRIGASTVRTLGGQTEPQA